MPEQPRSPDPNAVHPHALDRRAFLQLGGAAAAGALALPSIASGEAPIRPSVNPDERKDGAWRADFELEEATLAELQAGLQSGKYTARSLAQMYADRIAAMDRQGPELRHVLEINPQAMEIADRLDAERRAGKLRGPLHGIPVLVKDNIDTADRMTTTAGSLALEGSIAARDAFIVARLREAGALILGKTNLSEWANFRSTHSSSGWSSRGRQGRNPYVLDRSPCGSSSGTGGGIAASYAAVGVGTETDGSIVCPSAASALVGIKPTLGLVSRSGIIPIAHSQDTAGPMARTVADAATLLGVLAGVDPRDSDTAASRGNAAGDYTKYLDADGLRGARIGVARAQYFGYSKETDRIGEDAIQAMKDAGAVIVDPADIPHLGEYDGTEFTVLLYEFKADLNRYLSALGPDAPVHSLEEAIAFNDAHADRVMPYFGQEIFHMAQAKGPLTEKEYVDALARNRRLAGPEGILAALDQHNLDAIVAPTGNPVWPIDLVLGDHFLGGTSTAPAVAGYPHITVPGGYVHELPVGISFIGRPWSEGKLIRLAYAFEQATKHRRAPKYVRSLVLE